MTQTFLFCSVCDPDFVSHWSLWGPPGPALAPTCQQPESSAPAGTRAIWPFPGAPGGRDPMAQAGRTAPAWPVSHTPGTQVVRGTATVSHAQARTRPAHLPRPQAGSSRSICVRPNVLPLSHFRASIGQILEVAIKTFVPRPNYSCVTLASSQETAPPQPRMLQILPPGIMPFRAPPETRDSPRSLRHLQWLKVQ